ncbi:putative leader peptide [Rhodococcus rhodochrous]|uniref:putative leader peptide n=1 Tax=Rhodococcus rhodochrous TaxID=1829 RepID=UPI003B968497
MPEHTVPDRLFGAHAHHRGDRHRRRLRPPTYRYRRHLHPGTLSVVTVRAWSRRHVDLCRTGSCLCAF